MNEREQGKTDATAEKQAVLDRIVSGKYPLVKNKADLVKFADGECYYASSSFKGGKDFSLRDFLVTSLIRSSDVADPTFSNHGSQHATFQEAVKDLITSLETNPKEVKPKLQPVELNFDTNRGHVTIFLKRLVLEGKEKARRTFRPAPHQLALEIKSFVEENPKMVGDKEVYIQKVLRKTACELGIPFAIMTGVYLMMEPDKITGVFSNKDLRRNIQAARKERGVNQAKIPLGDMKTWTMISNLKRFVLVKDQGILRPNFDSKAYLDALGIFPPEYTKDFGEKLRVFEETDDLVTPKAVFLGLEEAAQREAAPDFIDPYRSEYIESKFGGIATSNLITAYYEFALLSVGYHFKDLLKVNGNGSNH